MVRACGGCRHFANEPAEVEAVLPGLGAFGSAHASVRHEDGICDLKDAWRTATEVCDAYQPLDHVP